MTRVLLILLLLSMFQYCHSQKPENNIVTSTYHATGSVNLDSIDKIKDSLLRKRNYFLEQRHREDSVKQRVDSVKNWAMQHTSLNPRIFADSITLQRLRADSIISHDSLTSKTHRLDSLQKEFGKLRGLDTTGLSGMQRINDSLSLRIKELNVRAMRAKRSSLVQYITTGILTSALLWFCWPFLILFFKGNIRYYSCRVLDIKNNIVIADVLTDSRELKSEMRKFHGEPIEGRIRMLHKGSIFRVGIGTIRGKKLLVYKKAKKIDRERFRLLDQIYKHESER